MKQEDRELLLKDLCARLPYRVKVGTADNDGSLENVWDMLWYNTFTEDLKLTHSIEDADKIVDISETKPYLFPLSSMTEEQKFECLKGTTLEIDKYGDIAVIDDCYGGSKYTDLEMYLDVIDWLNENHFDYRGLIEKGLAIDCTNLNIY